MVEEVLEQCLVLAPAQPSADGEGDEHLEVPVHEAIVARVKGFAEAQQLLHGVFPHALDVEGCIVLDQCAEQLEPLLVIGVLDCDIEEVEGEISLDGPQE